MNGALMQDQWEAMQEGWLYYSDIREVEAVPPGYVPVPPIMLSNRKDVHMIQLKEDE